MKKIIGVALVCFLAFGLLGCSKTTKEDNSLEELKSRGEFVLGLDDSFPPLGFRNEANEIVGYDIDLAGEVAKRLGVKLRCQPIDWTAKEQELATGNIDCIWNGFTMTAERLEAMSFTEPYLDNAQVVIVRGDSGIKTLADLAGKTIYASGKGSTPEFSLDYILTQAGLKDSVSVEWMSEHSECVAALVNDDNSAALLPQPFVTTAMMQNPDIRVAIDLNDAWDEVSPESSLITGVIVARKDFIEEHGDAVDAFLADYKESTEFTSANLEEAAALVGKYDIVPEAVALKALPECNIVCITGDEMKNDLSLYLEVLYNANPASVGGALPGEDFYYQF